jgi:DNA-binding FrmR family transcriptional regulator
MPSASDFFDELQTANTKLEQIKGQLGAIKDSVDDVKDATDTVNTSVQQVNSTLSTGFSQLITIGGYTNEALFHNAKQNDTIICLLDKIARNTCALVNYADEQTRLQRSIEETNRHLTELYAATHAEAEVQRQEHEKLRREVERCCPPPRPQPPCRFEPCDAPPPLKEPPRVAGTQPPVG